MTRRRLGLSCACVALVHLLGPSAARGQYAAAFSDGTFSPTQWTTTTRIYQSSASGSETGTQVATGGNPGSFWQVQTGNNSLVFTAHMHSDFKYTPSASGFIDSVRFDIDTRNISSYGNGGNFGLLIRQNGKYYFGTYEQTGSIVNTWVSHGYGPRTQNQFTDDYTYAGDPSPLGNHPDFSPTGSQIEFGFYTAQQSGSGITVGYDNYSVLVVPEPTGLLAAATAVGGVLGLARRRRPARISPTTC
jgi:hypothetical protein